MNQKLTLREYNSVDKLKLIAEHEELKQKIAALSIPLGISGDEVRDFTPDELKALSRGVLKGAMGAML